MSDRNKDETIDSKACAELFHCEDEVSIELLARNGQIPGAKIGRSWVFIREQMLDWLTSKAAQNVQGRQEAVLPPVATPASKYLM